MTTTIPAAFCALAAANEAIIQPTLAVSRSMYSALAASHWALSRALLFLHSFSLITTLLLLPGWLMPTNTTPPWLKREFSTNFSPSLPCCSSAKVVWPRLLALGNITLRKCAKRSKVLKPPLLLRWQSVHSLSPGT